MNSMTNKDLLLKMKAELQRYQIGFHNISLSHHRSISSSERYPRADEYKLDGIVTKERVAEQILEKGLNVCETGVGLSSTVRFFDEVSSDTLNYDYYSDPEGACNLIISVPYLINHNGKPYFIGQLSHHVNVGNSFLFNYRLPREFVYGYYTKDVIDSYRDRCGFLVCSYSDELKFHENPNFWANISPSLQEEIMEEVFKVRKGSLSALKLANNDNQFLLLFHPAKFAIRETREQQKTLKLNSFGGD